ncbi:MAG: DUF3738 domain-containing protein, partial [Bacteroidetes bacterium]|nr:DUF3738 domain-containing protein [Bacteroidota bacterium]
DSKGLVTELKKRVQLVWDCTLPSITGENDLASFFDYLMAPHQVWLDGNSVVVYNTNREIAEDNYIRDYLEGKRLNLYETKDTILAGDINVPLAVTLQPINKGNFIISSYLAPHDEHKYHYGGGTFGANDNTTALKTIRVGDVDMFTLYKRAYLNMEPIDFSDSRVIRNYNHPEKYKPDFINNKNIYDYDLTIKDKQITRPQFYYLMQQELNAFFGLKSSFQTREIPCYILKRSGNTASLHAKNNDLQLGFDGNMLTASYCDFGAMIKRLNERRMDKMLLVDETGLDPKMKVTCTFDMDFENDFDAARQSLARYGLTIIKGKRAMKCIVLDDARSN